ncbi:hypothetical protein R3P38DRAFT_3042906 [Favolaschia claudopus]|uniref:F-box domain-containing protein n=1 Tax=Favolaschia claudopus TaxID=2862362 RepID=A0AAW0A8M6_9AGAR
MSLKFHPTVLHCFASMLMTKEKISPKHESSSTDPAIILLFCGKSGISIAITDGKTHHLRNALRRVSDSDGENFHRGLKLNSWFPSTSSCLVESGDRVYDRARSLFLYHTSSWLSSHWIAGGGTQITRVASEQWTSLSTDRAYYDSKSLWCVLSFSCPPMPRATLPRELCDIVIDYLHPESAVLCVCALVCRDWVPASRYHLFEWISLSKNEAAAAARLDALLANPHATFARSVRNLTFHDALSPIQIRHSRSGGEPTVHTQTLLSIVPRIAQFTQVHTLSLTDLPFQIFSAFANVRTLYLIGVTAGPTLLRLATLLPRMTQLTLKRVAAIPYRAPPSGSVGDTPKSQQQIHSLHRITVRGSSIAFLGWLALLAPSARVVDLDDFYPSEMSYLVHFLRSLKTPPLESLELGLSYGVDVREFAWEELAEVLGRETRLTVSIDVDPDDRGGEEDSDDDEEGEVLLLQAQFSEVHERGMLEVRFRRA